jgi:hypothetical protein
MILRLALAVVLALLLPFEIAAQTPKKGGTLVVGMSSDLPGLDPHPSTSTITYQVLSLVYQGTSIVTSRSGRSSPSRGRSRRTASSGRSCCARA